MMRQLVLWDEGTILKGVEVSSVGASPLNMEWGETFSVEWEAGVSAEELANRLSIRVKEKGVTARTAAFVLSRNQVWMKIWPMPLTGKIQAEELIRTHWDEEMPLPEDEAVWDWEEYAGVASPLMVVAARRDRIAVLIEATRRTGIKCKEVAVSSFVLAELAGLVETDALRQAQGRPTVAMVYADQGYFEWVAVKNGVPMFARGTRQAHDAEAWTAESVRSAKAFQEVHPDLRVEQVIVNGEAAVGWVSRLETALALPVKIGVRSDHAWRWPVQRSKSKELLKPLTLRDAMDARTPGKSGPVAALSRRGWMMVGSVVVVIGMSAWWGMTGRTLSQVDVMEEEYRELSDQVGERRDRPWLGVLAAIQRALPADAKVTALIINEKREVTIEVTGDTFDALTGFYQRVARSPLLAQAQLGAVQAVTESNRQVHRSWIKAVLATEGIR